MGSSGSCSAPAELGLSQPVKAFSCCICPLLKEAGGVLLSPTHTPPPTPNPIPRLQAERRNKICQLVSAVWWSSAGEQDACRDERGWSRVRRLRDGGSGPQPGRTSGAVDDAGVGRSGAPGGPGWHRSVSLSLQLSGEHGGLPRPRAPLCTQKHSQRDRAAVSSHACLRTYFAACLGTK